MPAGLQVNSGTARDTERNPVLKININSCHSEELDKWSLEHNRSVIVQSLTNTHTHTNFKKSMLGSCVCPCMCNFSFPQTSAPILIKPWVALDYLVIYNH